MNQSFKARLFRSKPLLSARQYYTRLLALWGWAAAWCWLLSYLWIVSERLPGWGIALFIAVLFVLAPDREVLFRSYQRYVEAWQEDQAA